jgi:hypothetical protein
MSSADYSGMGRLGVRTPLDPKVQAQLVRANAQESKPRGLRRRAAEQPSSGVAVEIVDYSVTGIGFTAPAAVTLEASEVVTLQLQSESSATRVRIVGSRPVDGVAVWGAMFLDPWPELVRAIEESALHMNIEGEQARWNAQRR